MYSRISAAVKYQDKEVKYHWHGNNGKGKFLWEARSLIRIQFILASKILTLLRDDFKKADSGIL
jgi:hypothetical protein